MSEVHDAVAESRALDEGTETLGSRFAAHARVQRGLGAQDAVPRARPSLDIHARVMLRVGGAGHRSSWRNAWPVAIAAVLTLAAGIGWLGSHGPGPIRTLPGDKLVVT